MVELIAKTPCAGLLPKTIGALHLSELDLGHITSVMPLAGQGDAVSKALKKKIKAEFPAPNRVTGTGDARMVWTGVGQAFALGPALKPIAGAAMTDQSDAWCAVALEGPEAGAALARLIPIDLRSPAMEPGHCARSQLGHMSAIILKLSETRFELLVFRSMAETLVHEMTEVMETIAARALAR